MYKSEWNILSRIEPMLTGDELKKKLKTIPDYDISIREEEKGARLMKLTKLNSFYMPSDMSIQIYTELYLSMLKSLQRKESKQAVLQRNINGRNLQALSKGNGVFYDGIMGGSDSFSVLGCSGIGKTTALAKAIRLMDGENVIEMEKPYCKIIPIINVQCPFDCSAKSMLLAILQKIDVAIGTTYYDKVVKSKANTNTMLISVSQILLNHVGIVCIDEIQNLIKHKAGTQLVSMLTELLNESGVSIVFVGTPEVEPFFQSVDYLARRTLGFHFDRCEYNEDFKVFCTELWKYQYVTKTSTLSDSIIHWLYQHSAGVWAHVIYLYYTSQEISILDGREVIDMQALESAYQRMRMLHTHIQPDISLKKIVQKRKNKNVSSKVIESIQMEEPKTQVEIVVEHPNNKIDNGDWSFLEIIREAKQKNKDIVGLLKGKISITEIAV